jgi:DNA-binding NarL/FixJ family response regulator
MQIKVLLVEDHLIVRHGIRALIETSKDVQIIGEASDGKEALDKIAKQAPDIVLMDMNMPLMNGLECTKVIKVKYPRIKVLILTMHDDENYVFDMLDAGADGYILKNTSREELVFAIRKIANNEAYIGSDISISMFSKFRSEKNSEEIHKVNVDLTEGELSVLNLISEGLTNTEIADKLFTSVRTVETRRKKLLEKTGTNNTATLIRFAITNGIIR